MGPAVSRRFQVAEQFRKAAMLRGYKEISTPVVEYASTFTNEYVDMKLQNMMKWFNAEGEIEVLRPDWTTAIARALSNQEKKPQKWAYQGSVFKRSTPGLEYHQAGIEILHLPELMGDSECLLMSRAFLTEIGAPGFVIELGYAGIFEKLAGELDLSEPDNEKLRQAMHDKKKDEVLQIASEFGERDTAEELADLVDAYGFLDILSQYEKRWRDRPELLGMLRHIGKVARIVQETGTEDILVDLGRVKNLPYYSGIMFRGFLKETGAVCFSGGRYDRLYERFGEGISAVGLAFDVGVLAGQMQEKEQVQRVCIIAEEESLAFAEKVRAELIDVIADVQSWNADRSEYDRILEIRNVDGKFEVLEK